MLNQKALLRTSTLLVLLAMTAGAAASCGDEVESEVKTPVSETAAQTKDETEIINPRANAKDNLPDNLDFDGRAFTFFCSDTYYSTADYAGPETTTGDVVEDALFNRNKAVEDRLNISLVFNAEDNDGGQIAGVIRKLVMSGDTTNDVFIATQYGVIKLVTENCFFNANDLEYTDFNQPWWNNNYMEELSLGDGKRFFLVGDFDVNVLEWTRALFYNKVIYANYYDDADGLYKEVIDGKWTIDRMADISKSVYMDVNNDGITGLEDQLGFINYGADSSVDAFVYATDISFFNRTSDGQIQLSLMNEKAVTLAEKINKLYWQEGTYFDKTVYTQQEVRTAFIGGKGLFLGNASLGTANGGLREMEDDFGFLPYPKFDESQDGYHSIVHDGVLISAVSATSENTDIAGIVFEALNAETYRNFISVWYETALKLKYSRDDISSQMIDIIHDSTCTNFVFAYNYALNGAGLLLRDLVSKNSTDYVSLVSKKESGALSGLEKLNNAFLENN